MLFFCQESAIIQSPQFGGMSIRRVLKDATISLALLAAFGLSLQFQRMDVEEHITTIFVFAVFMISLLTRGYAYGIASAVVGTMAVNFAFTYPYFALDFINSINAISAVIMVTVAIVTGLLVTEVKRHEATKAESERERMRANLLRAVSHDLRTPLTTIYSASSMLRDGGETLTQPQRDSMLQSIQEDSEWLVRMVENLLTVTRIDNETMKIAKKPTILDELIDSAVTKFAARHPNQTVAVELPDEIVVIEMDTILIEQVILNLLENAVDHAKGMTELSMRVFTLGNQAIFEIADDGCGIEEGRLKHIFSGGEAQQDVKCEKKRFSGIGLSVCATIVKAHGGKIAAENRKSGGALFWFALKKEEAGGDEQ